MKRSTTTRKQTIREIIGVMSNYFDADNIEMSSTDDGHISVEMFSNESPYRLIHLNMVKDGPIDIWVDYSIPDTSTKMVRLWEIEFIGSIVSRFSPLTVDIAYPDELINDVKDILKNNFTGGEN